MNNQRLFTLLTLAFTLSFTLTHATDRSQFYDYSGNGNNISAANNGAAYDLSWLKSDGLNAYTFDGVNDYLNVSNGAGVNGLCNFAPSTNITVAIKVKINLSTVGNDMLLGLCHDTTANGSGYGYVIIPNVNRIAVENGSTTTQGSNTTMNLTYNQFFWVIFSQWANNTGVWMNNGSIVFNGSLTGQFANTTAADRTTIGARNGGAQLCQCSIAEILVYFRTLSVNEMLLITNGSASGLNFPNTTNLKAWWPLRNQTSANGSVNQNEYKRNSPTNDFGNHGQPSFISSFGQITVPGGTSLGTARNWLLDQALMIAQNAKYNRIPAHGGNVVSAVNIISATNLTLTYRTDTGAGVQERNVNHWRQNVNFSAQTGGYVNIVFDETPEQLANNSSPLCSYGVNATNRNSCMPYNFTLYTQYIARFIVDIGCFNYSNPVCVIAPSRNEPYNPGSTHFWLDNASCTQRTAELIRLWNQSGPQAINNTLNSWGYNTSKIVSWNGPSFADQDSSGTSCSETMETAFTAANPAGAPNSPNNQEAHLYFYDAEANTMKTKLSQWQSRMNNSSYGCRWGLSEGGLEDDSDNVNEKVYVKVITEEANLFLLSETCAQFNAGFQSTYYDTTTAGQNPSWFNQQFVNSSTTQFNTTYGKWDATRNIQQLPDNMPLYDCNMNTTAITCLYGRYNLTTAYIYLANNQANQADVDEINISGFTAVTAIRTIQGTSQFINTSETVTTGKLNPSPIYPYGSAIFVLTGTSDNLSLTQSPSAYIINISEPNSQQFNITVNNPNGQNLSIAWRNSTGGSPMTQCNNLTTCTIAGSYSLAGNYNITVNVTGQTNSVIGNWLFQVNNTLRNISFVQSPTAQAVPVYYPGNRQFSIAITNPDSIARTVVWRDNGSNVSTCYNMTSCTFTTNATNLGIHLINVTVNTAVNNPTFQWTATYETYVPPANCAEEGFNSFIGIAPILIAVTVILTIVGVYIGAGIELAGAGVALTLAMLIIRMLIACSG